MTRSIPTGTTGGSDVGSEMAAATRAGIARPTVLEGDLKLNNLEVRLAMTEAEVEAAQALRYRVFYEEMAAHPSPEIAAAHRDFDDFDALCDHLLVLDHTLGVGPAAVIATYRLIRRPAAEQHGSFYSASEYDITNIVGYPGQVLELGRSCVDQRYRNRPTMQLLWRGISAYVFQHEIALMFGCASLPGIEPQALALPLSYLYYHHLAPPALRPRALPERRIDMRLLAPAEVDPRGAMAVLPPLIKGYLRLGGFIGDGAVIDHQFNTTDVCVIVKTDLVTDKYMQHYARSTREPGAA
jgi:putative hemolysin